MNVSDPTLGRPGWRRAEKPAERPVRRAYCRPSALVDAVKIIADARTIRSVEQGEVNELLGYVEQAMQNLTKWAIELKQRRTLR